MTAPKNKPAATANQPADTSDEQAVPSIVKIERKGTQTITHWTDGDPTTITHSSDEAAAEYAGE